jgi:hypothetical protein
LSLTDAERRELADIERRAKALRAKKNAEAKERAARDRKGREKALSRAPGQRQPRERDPGYLAFLRRLPCVVCGATRRIEAAHVRAGYSIAGWAPTGMMQKPDDARAVPLCATCHREGPNAQHRANERQWWSGHGIDPPDLCRALHSAYLAGEDGHAVLRRFSTHRETAQ